MLKRGVFHDINGCISTGKEANVYHATKSDGQELAIKVYKTSVLVFNGVFVIDVNAGSIGCGLYNDEKDVEGKAEYICPKCYLEEIESGIRIPLPQTAASGAKDLPRIDLSDHIEQRLSRRLNQEREEMAKISGMELDEIPGAEGLVVRVVVSLEKQLEVRHKFIDILHGEYYPSGFTYRSKLIFLFQKIEGVDVCLFGMCVQEFGSDCGGPNQRCVYISYLNSVKYFRPERKSDWYKSMLKKAVEDDVVVDHTNLYNQFFVSSGQGNTKITAARLPYFDGDYWSGAAENIVRKLEVEESAGGLQSKLPNRRILKAMGQDKVDVAMKDVIVMQKVLRKRPVTVQGLSDISFVNDH